MTCSTCHNAQRESRKDGTVFTCRLGPPWVVERTIDAEIRFFSAWPEMKPDDWCRGFMHRMLPWPDLPPEELPLFRQLEPTSEILPEISAPAIEEKSKSQD